MPVEVRRGHWGPLELELEMLVWVLVVEPKSSARAASAFKLASLNSHLPGLLCFVLFCFFGIEPRTLSYSIDLLIEI